MRKIRDLIEIVISMAGFVPRTATIFRIIIMAASLCFSFYLTIYEALNPGIAIIYFLVAEILYLGFISSVLPENGLRHWFIRKWGDEKKGYRAYETILGFLFFHNGASIGYIASSSPGTLFNIDDKGIFFLVLPFLIAFGFGIKIWAAKVVSVDIYYWKDMFLGRKICDFVVTGPYKYFSNPMYGIGQLPAYATAIWYGSINGLIAAFVNQLLIFTFYFLAEKKFIKRVYLTESK
jgi:protein-S-isoprenylcysteine O-methyltransferase Ste14